MKNLHQLIKECVIDTLKEAIADNEDPRDAYYVEYVSERPGEEPFMLGDRKFQYVNCKYPDGKVDIGVYSFAGDLCYGYTAFRKQLGLNEGKLTESENRICSQCAGSGEGSHEGTKCRACHGSGEAGYKKPLTKHTDPDYDWDAERERDRLGVDEGSMADHKAMLDRMKAHIEDTKRAKELQASGASPDELQQIHQRIEKDRPWARNILHQAGYGVQGGQYMRQENLGRYAQDAGATDLKETLVLTATGKKDKWSRPVYTGNDSKTYVDINIGQGNPSIHSVTASGEPEIPVQNYTIAGQHDPKDTWQNAKRQADPDMSHYMGDGDRS